MILQLGTQIQTAFAEVDEAGNLVKRKPVTLNLEKLDVASFDAALKQLEKIRAELLANQ